MLNFLLETHPEAPIRMGRMLQPRQCVVEHAYQILVPAAGPEGFIAAGHVAYAEVKLRAALDRGYGPCEVMAPHSDTLEALFEVLYDTEDDSFDPGYAPGVADSLGLTYLSPDILFIRTPSLVDSALGLAVLEAVLDHSPCGVVVMQLPGLFEEWSDRVNFDQDIRRLDTLTTLGFRTLADSDFVAFDLGHARQPFLCDC